VEREESFSAIARSSGSEPAAADSAASRSSCVAGSRSSTPASAVRRAGSSAALAPRGRDDREGLVFGAGVFFGEPGVEDFGGDGVGEEAEAQREHVGVVPLAGAGGGLC